MSNKQLINEKCETMSPPPITSKRRRIRGKIILTSATAFIIIFSIVSLLITKNIYDSNFGRAEPPKFTAKLRYEDVTGYDRTEVGFMSGRNRLTGYIYGENNDKGLVVIAHGLGAGAESYLAETMFFVDKGWRVFSYDCTGSYSSEGESTKGLPQSALDLDAALSYVEQQNWNLPVMLYGHSWGGYAVAAVLNYDHDVSAVVSIAGYASPMELLYEQTQDIMGWFATITYPYQWLYQRMLFGDAAGLSAINGINKNGVPIMIIHGSEDEMIQYDGAGIIAHQNKIMNPNVVYKTRDAENQNGHSSLVVSQAQRAYSAEVNREYKAVYDSYGGSIPDEVNTDFYAGVDKYLASELDAAFMNEINTFFFHAAE